MNVKGLLRLILGIIVIACGVFLIYLFWKDLLVLLKGIVGILVVMIGLTIALIGAIGMKAEAVYKQFKMPEPVSLEVDLIEEKPVKKTKSKAKAKPTKKPTKKK